MSPHQRFSLLIQSARLLALSKREGFWITHQNTHETTITTTTTPPTPTSAHQSWYESDSGSDMDANMDADADCCQHCWYNSDSDSNSESDSDSEEEDCRHDDCRRVRWGAPRVCTVTEIPRSSVAEIIGRGYNETRDLCYREFWRPRVQGGCGKEWAEFERRLAQIDEPDFCAVGQVWAMVRGGEVLRPEELQELEKHEDEEEKDPEGGGSSGTFFCWSAETYTTISSLCTTSSESQHAQNHLAQTNDQAQAPVELTLALILWLRRNLDSDTDDDGDDRHRHHDHYDHRRRRCKKKQRKAKKRKTKDLSCSRARKLRHSWSKEMLARLLFAPSVAAPAPVPRSPSALDSDHDDGHYWYWYEQKQKMRAAVDGAARHISASGTRKGAGRRHSIRAHPHHHHRRGAKAE